MSVPSDRVLRSRQTRESVAPYPPPGTSFSNRPDSGRRWEPGDMVPEIMEEEEHDADLLGLLSGGDHDARDHSSVPGVARSLTIVLGVGQTTSGRDIIVSTGDSIKFGDSSVGLKYDSAGVIKVSDGGTGFGKITALEFTAGSATLKANTLEFANDNALIATTTTANGRNITIQPGDSVGSTRRGGDVRLFGGDSVGSSGSIRSAGNVQIRGGTGLGENTWGGDVDVTGGSGGTTSGQGGSIGFTGGLGYGTGPGGSITFTAGRTVGGGAAAKSINFNTNAVDRWLVEGPGGHWRGQNSVQVQWSSTPFPNGAPDAGVGRYAPNIIKLTDGATGWSKLALGGSTPLGSSGAVLGNVPAAAAIAQAEWLEVIVNGNTRYVPLWG